MNMYRESAIDYYSKIEVEGDVIIRTYSSEEQLSYGDLQNIDLDFALRCLALGTRLILEDPRALSVQVPDDYGVWVRETITPIYLQIPVRKVATLSHQDVCAYFQDAELDDQGIAKRVFISKEEALRWLGT